MADDSDAGDDAEVPDDVMAWLRSVADERDVSTAELLDALVAGSESAAGGDQDVDRLEEEFRSMIEDVRERVIQVKREVDSKATSDHTHHELRNSVEQLGREVGSLETQVDQLDERLGTGFENYEDILTYLTETTDRLDRRLGQLAAAVVNLRERAGEAARDEVRRTALSHLTETANRHGIETAKCEDCGTGVDLGLLVEPRCPHCESQFSALEPKRGFFRSSVLHTGTMPALESAPAAVEAEETDALEAMVESTGATGESPDVGPSARTVGPTEADTTGADETAAGSSPAPSPADRSATAEAPGSEAADSGVAGSEAAGSGAAVAEGDGSGAETTGGGVSADEGVGAAGEADTDTAPPGGDAPGEKDDGTGDLQTIEGIGPSYEERLHEAGIDTVLALAVADPEELGAAIGVSPTEVAEWVIEADAYTGT